MLLVRVAVVSLLHLRPTVTGLQSVRTASVMMRQASSRSSFRNPHNLPTKVCVVCNQEFTWRKKWEDCWDEVQCCSKRCNGERKKSNRVARGAANAAGDTTEDGNASSDDENMNGHERSPADDAKAARKAGKKAAKAEKRAKREGNPSMAMNGQKSCDLCEQRVDLLVRCQVAAGKDWTMVCGRCWKTPAVAGGVVDGDGVNPHYRYGGLWKNLHKAT